MSRNSQRQVAALKSQLNQSPNSFGWAHRAQPITPTPAASTTPRRERSPGSARALEQERLNASVHLQPVTEIRPLPQIDELRGKYKGPSLGLNKSALYTPARIVSATAFYGSEHLSPAVPSPSPKRLSALPLEPPAINTARISTSLRPATTLLKPAEEDRTTPRRSYAGIVNDGNTCFAAAGLQLLGTCDAFVEALKSENPTKEPLHAELYEFFSLLVQDDAPVRSLVLPRALKRNAPHLFDGRQQDAQEFFVELFSLLEVERGTDWPMQLFGASVQHQIRCNTCGDISTALDKVAFLDTPCSQDVASLEQLLHAQYSRAEEIDQYKCDKCNAPRTVTRTTRLHRLPEWVLCHIFRFGDGERKMATPVTIDTDMMLPMGDAPVRFALTGAVFHDGRTLRSGHYTAVVSRKGWVRANDAKVTPCEPVAKLLEVSSDVVLTCFKRL